VLVIFAAITVFLSMVAIVSPARGAPDGRPPVRVLGPGVAITTYVDRRVAIVISTHDLGLAGTLCDSLMLIRDGVVVASGPTDEVLTPANVREVYGVEADVIRHPSGHRVVVPVRRTKARDRG